MKTLLLYIGLLLMTSSARATAGYGSGIGFEIRWKASAKNKIVQIAIINHTPKMIYVARWSFDDPSTIWPAIVQEVDAGGKEIPRKQYFPFFIPKNLDIAKDESENLVDDVSHYIELAPGKAYTTETVFGTDLLLKGLNSLEFRYVGFIWIRRQANPDFRSRPERVHVSSNLLKWRRK